MIDFWFCVSSQRMWSTNTNSSLLPLTLRVVLTWLTECFQASKEMLFWHRLNFFSSLVSLLGHFHSEHIRKTQPQLVSFLLKSQVSPSHLLTASVMSAPASLAVAKLFWPETETPKITLQNAMKMESG